MQAQPSTLSLDMQNLVNTMKVGAQAARRLVSRSGPISAPKPVSLEDYKAALAAHDWFYDLTDDHSVWIKGRNHEARLRLMAKAIDPDWELWDSYAPRSA